MVSGGAAAALTLAACEGGSGEPATGDSAAPPATIANVADIPVGGALAVTSAAAGTILLTQPVDGEILAFSSVCTHAGCTVEPGEGELSCPCHGSTFDLATGDVTGGPATAPLPAVTITVADDGTITG